MTTEEREALANDIQKLPYSDQLVLMCWLTAETEEEHAECEGWLISKYPQTEACFKEA